MSIYLAVVARQHALDHDPRVIVAKRALDEARLRHERARNFIRFVGREPTRRDCARTRRELVRAERLYNELMHEATQVRR